MHIEIITTPLNLEISGFSGVALNRDYVGTAFKLMDKMWQVVKGNKLPNKGKNIWVYEEGDTVFAGVELNERHDSLESKTVGMDKYAYFKHTGAYSLIKQSGELMRNEIRKRGFETVLPYIEIYGDWTNDESKLETELIMCLK